MSSPKTAITLETFRMWVATATASTSLPSDTNLIYTRIYTNGYTEGYKQAVQSIIEVLTDLRDYE